MRRAVVPGVSGGEPKFAVYGEVSVWDFLHGGGPQLAMARVIGGRDGVSFGEVRAARRSNTREPDLESLRCILEPQTRTVLRSPLSTTGVFVHLEENLMDEVPKTSGPRGSLRAPVTQLPHSRRGTGSTGRVRQNEVPGGSHGRNSLVENFCVRQFVETFFLFVFLVGNFTVLGLRVLVYGTVSAREKTSDADVPEFHRSERLTRGPHFVQSQNFRASKP
ncbi:hypothetical protein MTP99_013128 [Tenebrio molitor]|nr:hypothetical protein MTP99_013128 [Tenebrio molitor]